MVKLTVVPVIPALPGADSAWVQRPDAAADPGRLLLPDRIWMGRRRCARPARDRTPIRHWFRTVTAAQERSAVGEREALRLWRPIPEC